MLHRSFKPGKCKTALKLAVSRIKLLKNKREAQLKQLKRELAQLLESGQDQTARIRVEHVVREEKTMAAYDLVEIYCELIAARLPMIESQKNCPIDLKEAISSIIFASPRCSDIPELMDVRKHMTAKYGKEFVSAAVELRPDCGVNRLLVEKLSARAPDGPTKVKILTAIAEEHSVKWEPKLFGENDVKSSQDLLVGPNAFEKATTYQESSQVHVPPVRDERGPPNLHASSQLKPMDDVSSNSYEQNASVAARRAGGNQSTTSSRPNNEIRSSGTGSQEMDFTDSYSENRSSFPLDRQNWNMEFKDAASAAQAAAESAERASMAARAAAELSNRENMTRQYSSGSHSFGSGFRDEVPQNYVSDKDASTGFINSSLHRSNSGMHNEQITSREHDNPVGAPDEYYRNSHENVVKHAQTASLMSTHAFGDDNPFGKVSQMPDLYSRNNSFEQENSDLHEVSIKKKASRTEDDYVTGIRDDDTDRNTRNNYPFGDARTNRQAGEASSSHSIFPSDDHNNNLNLNGQKMIDKAVDNHFVNEGNTERNSTETSYLNDTSVIFDNSGSEDDDYEFVVDKKDKGQGSSVFFSSPDIKSLDSLANASARSHGQVFDEREGSYSSQSHFSVVSEGLTKPAVSSEKEDLLPVAFDDSDDPGSDNEVDLDESKVSRTIDYGNSVLAESASYGTVGPSSANDKNVSSDRSSWLSPSSVGSDTVEQHFERNVGVTAVSEKNFGYDGLPTSQPSSEGNSSVLDLDRRNSRASQSPNTFNNTETVEESRTESGKELLYGTLKGGLRNKGYTRPPYIKKTLDEGSSLLGNSSAKNEQSPTLRTSISSDAPAEDKHIRDESRGNRSLGLRAHNASSDSDSYDLVSKETSFGTHDSHIQKEQSEAKKKPSTRAPVTYFDSDTSDSDDELPKQSSASLARPIGGFSRRTSAVSKTGAGLRSENAALSSKNAALSKASVTTTGRGLGWKSSTVSYENRNQKASSVMNSSENWASSDHGSAGHEASKAISEPSSSLREGTTKSSARVQPSNSVPETVITESEEVREASKSLNSEVDTPSKLKANHVHPKLPDYDSFAAHFLSLRKVGRQ